MLCEGKTACSLWRSVALQAVFDASPPSSTPHERFIVQGGSRSVRFTLRSRADTRSVYADETAGHSVLLLDVL